MRTQFFNSIKDAVKHWYIPLIVGILFIGVSILVFSSPLGSLLTLSIFFALSFLLGGIFEIIFSVSNRHRLENWGWALAFGIMTTLIGGLLILNPQLSLTALLFYVGFIILFRSIGAISFALDVKRYGSKNWGLLLAFGIIGAIVSFFLIWNPAFAGISVVILVAMGFLFGGLFNIYFSIQLRRVHKNMKQISPELRERYLKLEEDLKKEWNEDY